MHVVQKKQFGGRVASLSKQQLQEYADEGLSSIEIAEKTGLSECCVSDRAKIYAITLAKNVYNDNADYGQMKDLLLSGMSRRKIATKLRCKQSLVNKYAKELGLPQKAWRKRPEKVGEIVASVWCKIAREWREVDVVDVNYAWCLFMEQGGRCRYTGIPLFFARDKIEHGRGFTTASLDRIDSSLGHVKGNVQWVHQIVNFMKSILSDNEFIYWCQKVADYTRGVATCEFFAFTQLVVRLMSDPAGEEFLRQWAMSFISGNLIKSLPSTSLRNSNPTSSLEPLMIWIEPPSNVLSTVLT